ncbi:MAG TPA: taurine ABC transporter permease, partial [Candidatus Lambdaproteobacteria bacterium]|nr:taurine ABC transporter permease [Candidatus Lambdaproteobacteria bacterium]
MLKLTSLWKGLAGVLLLALSAAPALALDIKFTLDWKFQGPTSPFLLALHEGYYSDEGLDVSIDAGKGSAGAVIRVA